MGTVTTAGDPYAGPAAAITPTSLGLGNVTNTSDANKPVSTAQLAAIQARSNAVVTTTWANRATAIATIAALTPGKGWVFVSDVGFNGSLWWCTGSALVHDAPITLLSKSTGWLLPSLLAANAATYSQSGTTLTVTSAAHSIPLGIRSGMSVYLVIGIVSTGVAPTAPTFAGWFTDLTYVDANIFSCTCGNSQTGTGFVNSNTAVTIITELTTVLQGGLLGSYGTIEVFYMLDFTTSSNYKILRQSLAGNAYLNGGVNSNIAGLMFGRMVNIASNKQVYLNNNGLGSSSASSINYYSTTNTSVDQSITTLLLLSAANEYVALQSITTKVVSS